MTGTTKIVLHLDDDLLEYFDKVSCTTGKSIPVEIIEALEEHKKNNE